MHKPLIGLVVALLFAITLTPALAQTPTPTTPEVSEPRTCDGQSVKFHRSKARDLIAQGYSHKRWKDPSPAKKWEKNAWNEHRACIDPAAIRKGIQEYRVKKAKSFDRYRERQLDLQFQRRYTPYCGYAGQCWAIPTSIVACESGTSGLWKAYNPSGAAGPYQIMEEHGRPFPVKTEADRRAHHKIAASLWAGGSGASHWVCKG